MSGVVTEHLMGMVRGQVDRHGVVVWFDPERQYGEVVEALALPETAVHRYEDSFLALRRAVDPLLDELESGGPPRLVVYVPLAKEQTDDALVELTAGEGATEEAGLLRVPPDELLVHRPGDDAGAVRGRTGGRRERSGC
jgi:hypothetical protein